MTKSTLRNPQFFHTLVPGFHTQLVIPVDFFSKYIQGNTVEVGDTAELKCDSSDITWKVKLTGRRLTDGWEEFAVDNNFQTSDVLLVKYEGGLVFHVSDLGPECSKTPDINKHDVIGKTLLKKRLYPQTQLDFSSNDGNGDDDDDKSMELPIKKRVKNNGLGAEADSSSSSKNLSFVANVTASSLRTDTLYLPEYFTSSNGLTRECSKVVLIDGGERSWALDLSFSNSTDTFYIRKGWRSFCDENGQEAGGFLMLKLVGSGETPVLSFCPTESLSDRKLRDCSVASGRESLSVEVSSEEEYEIGGESSEDEFSSMDSLMEIESSEDEYSSMETGKRNYSSKRRVFSYASYSPCRKEFVTFTLPPNYVIIINTLSLPKQFTRENGIEKPGKICLVGKGGKKCLIKLLLNKRHGTMSFGKGWKSFVEANDIKTGFTLKLLWKDTTPVLCLCDAEFNIDREQEKFVFIDSSENQLVTLTITPSIFGKGALRLPKDFTMENGINKPGMITLLGKDGIRNPASLRFDKSRGRMTLGTGLKYFAKENGLKIGDSFTLELIWEDTTPVLRLYTVEHSIGKRGGCSETNQKKSLPREPSICKKISNEESKPMETHLRGRDSSPSRETQLVTLTITPGCIRNGCLRLPMCFTKENDINKPGMITLLGKDGKKHQTRLLFDKSTGRMTLGSGWKSFVKENGRTIGDSFTLEFIWEDTTPMLCLCPAGHKIVKRRRYSTPLSQKQFVTLTITPSSFSKCRLTLPAQFVRENSMNKPEKMYLVGKDGTKWPTCLQKDTNGTMGLGAGWREFGEAYGLKVDESFTMELIREGETPLLRWVHTEPNSSKANEKESVSTEPRGRDSSSAIRNKFVTLAPTSEDVSACQLYLTTRFMKANGINRLGKITIFGENGKEWFGYLLSKDGLVALGIGWDEFCEANGVKSGESFTLESINVHDKTSPVLKLCSPESNKYR